MQNKLRSLRTYCQNNKMSIVYLCLALGVSSWASKYLRQRQIEQRWKQVAIAKRTSRDQQIQEYWARHVKCSLSVELKKVILNSSIKQIQQLYYNGETTITEVLLLFIERTIEIAYPINCLTDINFDEALKIAKEQDELIKQDKEIIKTKALFGIPVSVKDMFIQKGFDTTHGTAAKCFKPNDYDGIQVALIKMEGGLIFVRTNIPQLAFTIESVNDIFGRVENPWDKSRSAGGSTGGEGAILAARCSVVGLGSDLGGSIRIPAAYCGVCGLKPCTTRQTNKGELLTTQSMNGQLNVKASKGPLARSVEDLEIMTRVLLHSKNYAMLTPMQQDLYWKPVDLKALPEQKQLRIGYISQFAYLTPPQCMTRAVHYAKDALLSLGYEMVEFKLDELFEKELCNIFSQILSSEGGYSSFYQLAQGEKLIEEYDLLIQGSKISNCTKKYIISPLLRLLGQQKTADMADTTFSRNVYEFLCLSGKQKDLNEKLLMQMHGMKLDGIICPAFGAPALKHKFSKNLTILAIYTWIWNTVDLPAGSLPVTVVQDELDQAIPGQEDSCDNVYKLIQKSMIGSKGLPVNVQVVTYPQQEEMCLRIMKDIEQQVKFTEKHPYPY